MTTVGLADVNTMTIADKPDPNGLQVEPFSDRSVLISGLSTPGSTLAHADRERLQKSISSAVTVRTGIDSILISTQEPSPRLFEYVSENFHTLTRNLITPQPTGRHHHVAACFDGTDLRTLAASTGESSESFTARFCSITWTVSIFGFAPGFAYLTNRSESSWFNIPRRSTPRSRVAPGSIATADGMACIYPGGSPGGWAILGHTDLKLFDNLSGHTWAAVGDTVTFSIESP
jgi:allophanate hydrolase subunit 1